MPVRFTDEIRAAMDVAGGRAPCLLATASPSGMPDVGYRGSMVVLDDSRLAFWERSQGTSVENLRVNPQVCVFYHQTGTKTYWRFYGRAQAVSDPALRARIFGLIPATEQGLDPERKGTAFVVEVELVREKGTAVMSSSEP